MDGFSSSEWRASSASAGAGFSCFPRITGICSLASDLDSVDNNEHELESLVLDASGKQALTARMAASSASAAIAFPLEAPRSPRKNPDKDRVARPRMASIIGISRSWLFVLPRTTPETNMQIAVGLLTTMSGGYLFRVVTTRSRPRSL